MIQSDPNRLLLVEKVLILKSLSIFSDTPEHILADLAPLMEEEDYEKDNSRYAPGR